MRIDLHAHSTESDGTLHPAAVMAAAQRAGLDAVALTDHDTTRGWPGAAAAVPATGVALVPGIEVSCAHRGISVHLLGYLIDPSEPGLLQEIERARESRLTRARRIVDLLGPDTGLRWDEVTAQAAPGATLGRPHIADALVARGIVASREEAFEHYLHSRSRYHASHYAPDPVHAVELVRAAGGVPVMAHPFAAQRGRIVDDEVIERMADAGLAGLEVYHRDHDVEATEHAADLVKRLGLLATGSSDFHGAGKPNRLGEHTTDPQVLTAIETRATSGTAVMRP
ncbi:PHP domain-containing protein [Leekyejoonella antrihumi]|uniref:PHP domain-containing protein n=1 Tax=Leekyejoonella antrihumi TaxID=1660198 RepID=A0A563DUV6_9MICO|nr:PHP domain-containing protein [Leekyejoonella antrihumi]TWP33741.1 PHP domain-containing protein [Leekyejoonella antrihumi]